MKLQIAQSEFRRSSPVAFGKLAPIPSGWIVLRSSFVKTKMLRRKTHGKWVRIRSSEGTIYRILRYSPNIKQEKIVVDWIGWIDLQGRTDEESEKLDLKIDLARWWHFFLIPFVHPEPAYRLSSIIATALGVPSVLLGVASIWLSITPAKLQPIAKIDHAQAQPIKDEACEDSNVKQNKSQLTAHPKNRTPSAAGP